jgi:SAM-dependent methyltransferase
MGTSPDSLATLREALYEAIAPHCPPPRPGERTGPPPAARGPAGPPLTRGQWRRIGRQILALHEGYTTGRADFSHEQNPIHDRLAGYQLYFLPRNLYRALTVLEELPWRPGAGQALADAWGAREPGAPLLRLLDLGCGTGAFSLAWLAWLAQCFPGGTGAPALHLTLVDQGRALLGLAEANLRGFAARALPGVPLRIDFRADGVERFLAAEPQGGKFAVAGAAMMLGELSLLGPRRTSTRAARFSESLRRRVVEGGCVMLVEPGTRKGYMNLMALRDRLAGEPILYPCPHGKACPLWENRVRSWCHATQRLPEGFFFDGPLKRLKILDFEMRTLNLAALVYQVGRGGAPAAPFQARPGARILSEPLPARAGPARAGPLETPGPGEKGRGRPHAGGRKARPAGGAPAEPAPTAPRVLLVCAGDGRLEERPADIKGGPLRGRWIGAPNRRERP